MGTTWTRHRHNLDQGETQPRSSTGLNLEQEWGSTWTRHGVQPGPGKGLFGAHLASVRGPVGTCSGPKGGQPTGPAKKSPYFIHLVTAGMRQLWKQQDPLPGFLKARIQLLAYTGSSCLPMQDPVPNFSMADPVAHLWSYAGFS